MRPSQRVPTPAPAGRRSAGELNSSVRIAHAVTLISDSGAYGGPVSVACAQARALQERGHRLQIAALWRGASAPPSQVDGVDLHADRARVFIPRTGFLGLFSPTYPR